MSEKSNAIGPAAQDSVMDDSSRRICDYEGSTYQSDFWIGQNRDYEDQVERIAILRLLPPRGNTLIEVGAGFGRLAQLYSGYERVILADYSRSLLRQAQERLGRDNPRYIYVAADLYNLPFVHGVVDTAVMVRVAHHLTDVPSAFLELSRIIGTDGCLILEFANKKNVKAILRYLLKRQSWNPFTQEPVEFVELNYNFHPRWIEHRLAEASLEEQSRLSVSHFRVPFLKRVIPLPMLVAIDSALQKTGRWWLLSPSGFLRVRQQARRQQPRPGTFFRCPACHGHDLHPGPDCLACADCGTRWGISDNLYDFKSPL